MNASQPTDPAFNPVDESPALTCELIPRSDTPGHAGQRTTRTTRRSRVAVAYVAADFEETVSKEVWMTR